MGKIRIKTFGDETTEEAEKQKADVKRAEKLNREKSEDEVSEQPESPQQPQPTQPAQTEPEASSKKQEAAKPRKSKFIKQKSRSSKYKTAVMEIEKNKTYSIQEGIELLKKMQNLPRLTASQGGFDETVELHINTIEAGISGQVKLPHGTGKEIRIAIATDELLNKIEAGKLDFDILIAEPSMMPKLAKVAKVLGPRGLMPNPKNGTISTDPQEAMKKFQGGQIHFKTESKIPLIHLSVGKTSFEDKQLAENIKTIITAIKKDRIRSVTLKSTMSPGIRLQV